MSSPELVFGATAIPCTHGVVSSAVQSLTAAGLLQVAANFQRAIEQDVQEGKPLKSMCVREDRLWYGRHCMGVIE